MSRNVKMKVLVVSRTFPPAVNPEGLCTFKFAMALAGHNFDVKVLTCLGNELQAGVMAHDPDILDIRRVMQWRGNTLKRYLIYGWYALKNRVPVSEAWFVDGGIRLAKEMLSRWKPDVIYARGLPSAAWTLGAIIARRYNIPLIMHMSDPWPRSLAPAPYGRRSYLDRYVNEPRLLRFVGSAAAMTFPSRRLGQYMAQKLSRHADIKFEVIPHVLLDRGGDQNDDNSDILADIRRTSSAMKIVHLGTLDEARSPGHFLDALSRVLERGRAKIKVWFVGHRWESQLSQMIQERGLSSNVFACGVVSYRQAMTIASAADALLLIEAPCKEGIFLPSKFVDYCWTGKPILDLSPPDGEVADYMKSYDLDVVAPENTDGICDLLDEMFHAWQTNTLAKHSTAGLRTMFAEEAIVDKFAGVINELAG